MKARTWRSGIALMAVGSLTTGIMAVAAVPASAAGRAQVNNCGTLEIKPTDLVLACADANAMLTELKWSGWSNGRAKGSGVYELNDCKPTCVAGTTNSYPVRVLLSKPKVQGGERVLSKVTMTFTAKSPTGKKKASVTLLPSRAPEPTPAPSATAPAEPAPSATPEPTATATPEPTATATPTPTPTATATTAAIAPPSVTITERKRIQGSARYTLTASSKARGGIKGISTVTSYQANDENAELPTKGTYLGDDAGAGDIWTVNVSCNPLWGNEIRIVVKATDGQTTTIREKRPC